VSATFYLAFRCVASLRRINVLIINRIESNDSNISIDIDM